MSILGGLTAVTGSSQLRYYINGIQPNKSYYQPWFAISILDSNLIDFSRELFRSFLIISGCGCSTATCSLASVVDLLIDALMQERSTVAVIHVLLQFSFFFLLHSRAHVMLIRFVECGAHGTISFLGPCSDCKFLQSGHCSTFRLYLINFVRLWTNQAQKIRLVIYNQTV